jgi:dTDP-4-amino-4,6-dideoxygalactose transaminase
MLVDNREGFYRHMKEKGVMVSQVHERNDKHTCMTEYKTFLPTLDKTIGRIVSIPVGYWVGQEQREFIVDAIKQGW